MLIAELGEPRRSGDRQNSIDSYSSLTTWIPGQLLLDTAFLAIRGQAKGKQ